MLPLPVRNLFKKHIWKLDVDTPQTSWMKYGLESESAAVKQYEIQTSLSVSPTGLWVNPQLPYITCSPDGLVSDDGLLEIKSLKIFHDNTIDQIVNEFDLFNDNIANAFHGNSNELNISCGESDYVYHDNGDHCSGVSNLSGYTRDEINIAVFLTTCAFSNHSTENNLLSDCNLKVIPWSGKIYNYPPKGR